MLGLKSLAALAGLLTAGACTVPPPATTYSYYGAPAYTSYPGYYGAPAYYGYPGYYSPYLGGPAVTLGFFGGGWGQRYGYSGGWHHGGWGGWRGGGWRR
jgi:hypothetical protein